MKSSIDGNTICLTNDDFECLATDEAVFCDDFRQLAVALVLSCEIDGVDGRTFFLYPEDFPNEEIGFKEGGKIPSVKIEWVDEPKSE